LETWKFLCTYLKKRHAKHILKIMAEICSSNRFLEADDANDTDVSDADASRGEREGVEGARGSGHHRVVVAHADRPLEPEVSFIVLAWVLGLYSMQ
jgi:hypothetical protein